MNRAVSITKARSKIVVSKKSGWHKGQAIPGFAWKLTSLTSGGGSIYVPAELVDSLEIKEGGLDLLCISSFDELEAALVSPEKLDPELMAALDVVKKHLGDLGRFPLIVGIFGEDRKK